LAAARNFANYQCESPCFAAGAFCCFDFVHGETNLETGEEDAAIPVIGFQVVVQAGFLPLPG
jgi:hypothetical protein